MTSTPVGQQPTPQRADISAADKLAQGFNRDLQRLVERLTGWRPWHSTSGALYATRAHKLTQHEVDAHVARTVCADDPDDLAALIVREQRRAEAVSIAIRK